MGVVFDEDEVTIRGVPLVFMRLQTYNPMGYNGELKLRFVVAAVSKTPVE